VIAPLSKETAGLLVVDIQDRLVAAMPAEIAERVVKNACILIEAARRFALPIVVTQQYPKGLGQTVPAIEQALAGAELVARADKVDFSAAAHAWAGRTWIVAGMETHVCVYQTVRAIAARDDEVYVVADAACSRTKASWRIGLQLCARAGAIVTTTEACVFDLLERAGSDDFKALSKLVK
jgi:nicotinamidase-related amidase